MSKECSFCKREGIEPPAIGTRATGSYRSLNHEINKQGEYYQPVRVFNGYVCEMHADTVEWVKLTWQRNKPEFPHGEFDSGLHWRGEYA